MDGYINQKLFIETLTLVPVIFSAHQVLCETDKWENNSLKLLLRLRSEYFHVTCLMIAGWTGCCWGESFPILSFGFYAGVKKLKKA